MPTYRCLVQQRDRHLTKSASDGLEDTAWGPNPGRWPLPTRTDVIGRWERAVALAGQGRYALARAELDAAQRTPMPQWIASLMLSTRASWLRQIGAHTRAGRLDGAAVSLVGLGGGAGGVPSADSANVTAARCDALTGLGADALGGAQFAKAGAMLDRCEELLVGVPATTVLRRQNLRLHWVRAELAMVSGNGKSAMRHALTAEELAADTVSLRHRTKTGLIVAAAHSSVGEIDAARVCALEVWEACSESGLVPLQWAAAMLLGSLGDSRTWVAAAAECAAVLRRRGGVVAGA